MCQAKFLAVLCHSELKSHPNFNAEEVACKRSDKEPMDVVVKEADPNVEARGVACKRSHTAPMNAFPALQQRDRRADPNVEAGEAACKRIHTTSMVALPAPRHRVRKKSTQDATGQIIKKQRTDQPDVTPALVLRRPFARSKARGVVERGRGRPKGSTGSSSVKKDRPGKSGCISIASKLRIVKRYEELKLQGNIKNVESWLLKNEPASGFYQGCLSKVKWLGSRERQGWDAFVKHCPDLAKNASEVPSSFKAVIGKTVALVSLYIYIYLFRFHIYIYMYTFILHIYIHTHTLYIYIHMMLMYVYV